MFVFDNDLLKLGECGTSGERVLLAEFCYLNPVKFTLLEHLLAELFELFLFGSKLPVLLIE